MATACNKSARKRKAGIAAKKLLRTAKARIETASDVTDVLNDCVNEVYNFKCDPLIRARTMSLVCGTILKAIEVSKKERALANFGDGLGIPVIMMPTLPQPAEVPKAKKKRKKKVKK